MTYAPRRSTSSHDCARCRAVTFRRHCHCPLHRHRQGQRHERWALTGHSGHTHNVMDGTFPRYSSVIVDGAPAPMRLRRSGGHGRRCARPLLSAIRMACTELGECHVQCKCACTMECHVDATIATAAGGTCVFARTWPGTRCALAGQGFAAIGG